MIEAVTFDVWETLIHDDPTIAEARNQVRVAEMARVLRDAGFFPDARRLRQAYDRSWRTLEAIWRTGQERGPGEQVEVILGGLDPAIAERIDGEVRGALEAAYVEPIFAHPPVLDSDALGVLLALQERGLKRGLICNTGRTPGYAMRRLLDGFGILSAFDAFAFSNEERVRKPDRAIFERVLARLSVSPRLAVHIGDDVHADIGGAKNSGLAAVLFQPSYPASAPTIADARVNRLGELLSVLETL